MCEGDTNKLPSVTKREGQTEKREEKGSASKRDVGSGTEDISLEAEVI